MFSVHCRVIVENMCGFQHASSHDDCTFDARLVSKTRKDQQFNQQIKRSTCVLGSWWTSSGSRAFRFHHTRVPTQLDEALASKTRVPSLSGFVIASMFLPWALSSNRQDSTSHCSQWYWLHIACLSCSYSSLFSRHGPFTPFCTRLTQHCQVRHLALARLNRSSIIL